MNHLRDLGEFACGEILKTLISLNGYGCAGKSEVLDKCEDLPWMVRIGLRKGWLGEKFLSIVGDYMAIICIGAGFRT